MSDQRSWFEIRNAAKGATEIYVYDEIGKYGVSGAAFAAALSEVQTPQIDLFINSPGGAVDHGKAIFNALQRHSARVRATVDGMAASIASLIVQAADERVMASGASMMIHEPHVLAFGDCETLQQAIDYLNVEGDSIAEIYAQRAGGTAEEWRGRMKQGETWYRADEAVAAGLADRTAADNARPPALASAVFNLSHFKSMPEWAKNALNTPESERNPAEKPVFDADHGWPFLAHHDAAGAVDAAALRVALARAKDLNIPVANREKALHHLNGHAKVAAHAA